MRRKFYGLAACALLIAGLTACAKEDTKPSEPETTVETTVETTESENTTDENKSEENTEEATEKPDESPVESPEDTSDESSDEASSEEDGNNEADEDDLAAKLAAMFKEEIANSTDIYAIAENLSSEEVTGYSCGVMEVEEGYLTGFDDEVKGFKKGVNFGPWIGTIPFVGYIFEVDDPESFKAELESLANPRWNICTEAQEPVFEIYENYVFVTMVPMPQEF